MRPLALLLSTTASLSTALWFVALLTQGSRVASAFQTWQVPSPFRSPKSLPYATNTPGSELSMTIISYNGKKKDFKPGSPLSKAVAQLGIKPTYSCKKYATHAQRIYIKFCYVEDMLNTRMCANFIPCVLVQCSTCTLAFLLSLNNGVSLGGHLRPILRLCRFSFF